MENIELSFGDRLERGDKMWGVIEEFDPAFAPIDTSLEPANFATFLALVAAKNQLVANAVSANNTAIANHAALYELIKNRTLRVVDTVAGNEAWSDFMPKLKAAAAVIRNNRRPKKPLPPPPGGPTKKPRKTGQQSYGDIDVGFQKFIEEVREVTGYMPPSNSNIQLTQLETLLTEYRTANKNVATKGAALGKAQDNRLAIYDAKKGSLRAKMKAIKKATGGQYGRGSDEFAAVNEIAL